MKPPKVVTGEVYAVDDEGNTVPLGYVSDDGIDLGGPLVGADTTIVERSTSFSGEWKFDDPDAYRQFLRLVFGVWYIPGVRHLYTIGERDE